MRGAIFIAIMVLLAVASLFSYAHADCESGHWVTSVSSDGEIVILEDGSVWEVDTVDAIDSTLWLPTSDIIACDDKLINTDDNEIVSAHRIR